MGLTQSHTRTDIYAEFGCVCVSVLSLCFSPTTPGSISTWLAMFSYELNLTYLGCNFTAIFIQKFYSGKLNKTGQDLPPSTLKMNTLTLIYQ